MIQQHPQPGLIEYSGAGTLPEVASRVLEDRSIHLAIVRGALANTALIDMSLGGMQKMAKLTVNDFYDAIPELTVVDDIVHDWVSAQPFGKVFEATKAEKGSVMLGPKCPHVDNIHLKDNKLLGPLSMSVRWDNNHDALRIYKAQRISKNPTITADGENINAIKMAYHRGKRLGGLIRLNKLALTVEQRPGDMILFKNHPDPTAHAIETESLGTGAGIFDYYLIKK